MLLATRPIIAVHLALQTRLPLPLLLLLQHQHSFSLAYSSGKPRPFGLLRVYPRPRNSIHDAKSQAGQSRESITRRLVSVTCFPYHGTESNRENVLPAKSVICTLLHVLSEMFGQEPRQHRRYLPALLLGLIRPNSGRTYLPLDSWYARSYLPISKEETSRRIFHGFAMDYDHGLCYLILKLGLIIWMP